MWSSRPAAVSARRAKAISASARSTAAPTPRRSRAGCRNLNGKIVRSAIRRGLLLVAATPRRRKCWRRLVACWATPAWAGRKDAPRAAHSPFGDEASPLLFAAARGAVHKRVSQADLISKPLRGKLVADLDSLIKGGGQK